MSFWTYFLLSIIDHIWFVVIQWNLSKLNLFGPAFVFRIDRCLVYTGWIDQRFPTVGQDLIFGLYRIPFNSGFCCIMQSICQINVCPVILVDFSSSINVVACFENCMFSDKVLFPTTTHRRSSDIRCVIYRFSFLPMQSVPITTNIVSSNPAQAGCTRYNIMWYSLSVTSGRSSVFSWYSGFLHQWNWPPRYSWNIFDSGDKHPNPNPYFFYRACFFIWIFFC